MNSVIIYTKQTCGFCYRAKDLLDSKGVNYEEIAIDFSFEKRKVMIEITGGYTVPQIIINEQAIGGCNELYALEHKGLLDDMLESNKLDPNQQASSQSN